MEDKKFILLLEAERHKELIKTLRDLPFERMSDNHKEYLDKIETFCNISNDKISLVLQELKHKDEKDGDKEVLSAINTLKSELINSITQIKEFIIKDASTMKEWSFTVTRDNFRGMIETITAKQIK